MRRLFVLAMVCVACRSRGTSVDAGSSSTPHESNETEGVPWRGEELPARVVAMTNVRFVLGDDVRAAMLTPSGWIGLRGTIAKSDLVKVGSDGKVSIVEPRGLATDLYAASLAGSAERILLRQPNGGQAILMHERLESLPKSPAVLSAFELGARTIAVANAPEREPWHTFSLEGGRTRVIASGGRDERVTSAARLGTELVICVKDPDGALVHIDGDGNVTRREPFPGQRPQYVAATDDGWLLATTQGTEGLGFRDAVLVGRPAGSTSFRLLARKLEVPTDFVQGGSWACFVEQRMREERSVHCFSPGRDLHVKAESHSGLLTLFGIETKETSRLILGRTGAVDQPGNEILAMSLP